MVKKIPSKASDASVKLLDLNAKLHSIMADIVNEKKVEEDIAVIPSKHIKEAYIAGLDAATILNSVKPSADELLEIGDLIKVLPKVIELYPEVEGNLTMPAELANDLNGIILNHLANKIHDAGMSLIGATGTLQACTIAELEPEEAAAVGKYCSGVLPQITHEVVVTKLPVQHVTIKGEKKVLSYPSHITHKLGIHKIELSTKVTKDEEKVALEYRESGPQYHEMPFRQRGVHDRLVKEGFECNVGKGENIPFGKDLHLYCWGEVDKEKLRRLATFFSLLLNADVCGLGKDVAPLVTDKVWDIAGKLNQQYGDDTWKSGQGQLNWSGIHHQWQEEKVIYEKNIIYTDLRNLTILRDKHHELIEEAYGVEAIHAPGLVVEDPEGIKKVIKNAHEAIAILKKNKWNYSGLQDAVNSLEKSLAAGQKKLMGYVDGVGHIMHTTCASLLAKEGVYGGCSMTADIFNINAGNLAYCEGVLKGTSASLTKSGNMAHHKVAPHTYITFILDEDPKGGYHVTIPLPEPIEWNKPLAKYLKAKHGFKCVGSNCKVHINSLDKIRELALFFSNLRGASGEIGLDCAEQAISLADKTAEQQNEKGVFAFTQEPVMPNAKAWIDMCHKKYGILPPGLTEEEKIILELIGPEQIYAGCSFAMSEIIPNKGILTYCEGVRKNPQSEVNAHLDPKGELAHYFHEELDKIADVNIIPLGGDKYQVELKDIDLRGPHLQKAALKLIKGEWMPCPTDTACSGELNFTQIRQLAAFLSSVHQIYKLEPSCVPAAVDYVVDKINKLPDDKTAHDSTAYPWYAPEWNKEVCAKVEPSVVEAVPPKEKVKEWQPNMPSPSPPFKVYGCTSVIKATPTKVKQQYCAGVIGKTLFKGEEGPFLIPGLLPETAALLGAKENWHNIGTLYGKVLFDSKWNTIYITLPPELLKIEPLVETLIGWFNFTQTENTFSGHSYPSKTGKLARFFSYLSNIQSLPESCHQAAVTYAFDKAGAPGMAPIYPFASGDWMKEVCEPPEKPKASIVELEVAILAFLKPSSPAEWSGEADIQVWLKEHYDVTNSEITLALQKLLTEEKIVWELGKGFKLVEKPLEIDIKTFKWHGPTESFAATVGGNWSIPTVHIVGLVQVGISKDQLISLLTNEECWDNLASSKIHITEVAEEIVDFYMPEEKKPPAKPIISYDQLKSVILKEIENYPGILITPTEMLEIIVNAGWEPKDVGDIEQALASLELEKELVYPEPGKYLYKPEKKPLEKTFATFGELQDFMLGYMKAHPLGSFNLEHFQSVIEEAGYYYPAAGNIQGVLANLVTLGEAIQPTAGFYTYLPKPGEKLESLYPLELKEHVLSAIGHAPDKKTQYDSLVNSITEYYDVGTGPDDEVGTIAWAVWELVKEGKLSFLGGTTFGLPEEAVEPEKFESVEWEPPFEIFQFGGFDWYVPKAHIVKLVQAGISKPQLIELLKAFTIGDYGSLSQGAAEAVADLYIPKEKDLTEATGEEMEIFGEEICAWKEQGLTIGQTQGKFYETFPIKLTGDTNTWIVGVYDTCPIPKPSLDELVEKSLIAMQKSYTEITKEMKLKAQETKEYKKLPSKVKEWMHLAINYNLLLDHKFNKGMELTLKLLNELFLTVNKFPITPLMVKLQTDIEKKSKIRKGELPAEPGEKVAKTYEELTEDEKAAVKEEAKSKLESFATGATAKIELSQKFGIEFSEGLDKVVMEAAYEITGKPTHISDLPMKDMEFINSYIALQYLEEVTADKITTELAKAYPSVLASELLDYVTSKMGELVVEKGKEWQNYKDLSPAEQESVKKDMKTCIELEVDKITCIKSIREKYKLELTWLSVLWNEIKAEEKEEKPKKKPKHFEDLTDQDKKLMSQSVKEWLDAGMKEETIYKQLAAEFSLMTDLKTEALIDGLISGYKEAEEGKIDISQLVGDKLEEAKNVVELLHSEGKSSGDICQYISAEFNVDYDEDLEEWVDEILLKIEKLPIMPKEELTQWLQSYLVAHPGLEFNATELSNILEQHPKWEFPGISSVGDALVKLAEAGVIKSELPAPGKPLVFWYEKKEKPKKIHSLTAEEKEAIQSEIGDIIKSGSHPQLHYIADKFNVVEDADLAQFITDTEAYFEEEEEEKLKYYSDLSHSDQLKVTADIEQAKKIGTTKDELVQYLHEAYGIFTDTPLSIYIDKLYAEEPETTEIAGQTFPTTLVEATKKTITDGYDTGLSLPNIVQNAYSTTWKHVKPNVFKEWVKEVIEEHEKAKEKQAMTHEFMKAACLTVLMPHTLTFSTTDEVLTDLTEKYGDEYAIPKLLDVHNALDSLADEKLISIPSVGTWKYEGEPQPPVSTIAEAINIIKGGEVYAGCHPDSPGVELSPIQIIYCEGIMTPPGKKKAGYVQFKDHEPIVSQYGDGYNVIATSKEEGLTATFKDIDKAGKEWKKRQESVAKTLVDELGYDCFFMDDHFLCTKYPLDLTMKKERDLVRTTAIFMSSLHDIDKVEAGCVDDAVRYALAGAKNINKIYEGPKASELHPYPYTKEDWNKEVCSQIITKPVRLDAKTLAQQLGTTGLLDAAHKMGIDPSGSDEILAKKLLDADFITGG